MENLSLREAVKLFNVSRPTLTKALNSGKLSGVRNGKGQWEISPSELARVYQPRTQEKNTFGQDEHAKLTTLNMAVMKLEADLALAEARAEAAEKLAQERAGHIEDLRKLLPAPDMPMASPLKRSWWPWKKS